MSNKYNFLVDEGSGNEHNIDVIEDSDVVTVYDEHKQSNKKNVFRAHGKSLILFILAALTIIIVGIICIKLAKGSPLYIPSIFIPIVGLLVLLVIFYIINNYFKEPSIIEFDSSTGSMRVHRDYLCNKKVQAFSLDEIKDVKVTKQIFQSGQHYQKIDYRISVEMNDAKTLTLPLGESKEISEREEFVNKIAYDLSIILSNHKRAQIILTVNDLGTKNIE